MRTVRNMNRTINEPGQGRHDAWVLSGLKVPGGQTVSLTDPDYRGQEAIKDEGFGGMGMTIPDRKSLGGIQCRRGKSYHCHI